ncbi:MAG: Mov34/MPN/PAD-1 family protein [Vicinamibacterales bacterium]
MSRLRIADGALEAIRRHAAETYPDECCGALIGHADSGSPRAAESASSSAAGSAQPLQSVISVVPLANTTDEGARTRFLVRPADYRHAEARARADGAELVGFYHSHPDHPARPSEHDLDHAWPNLSYVIVAVERGRPGAIASWRLRADRTTFDEEGLEETRT